MPKKSSPSTSPRPQGSTDFLVNLFTCIIFFLLALFIYKPESSSLEIYLMIIFSVTPIIIYDFIYGRKYHQSYALSPTSVQNTDLKRIAVKLFGLYGTFAFLFLVYWLFPVYHDKMYDKFFIRLEELLPWLCALAIPYFIYVDKRMKDPYDGYWHFGNLLLLKIKLVDKKYTREHIKAWVVKGFFLPLMGTFLVDNLNFLVTHDFKHIATFKGFYDYFYNFIFTVDLLFATIGYIFTLKLFNSQIYSSEPTMLGWVVCLMGYPPFWPSLFSPQYFAYDDNFFWGDLFWNNDFFYILWGSFILICLTVYSFSTIAFGYRFSNLTYRGLITNGPYALTKHPAYVFKNISWWLISIPFFSALGWQEALRNCLMLFGVNIIYYIRARTEENHLSNYPEYVEYAVYMNQKSIFAWLGNYIPFFKYSKERALNSGSKVYKPFTQRL